MIMKRSTCLVARRLNEGCDGRRLSIDIDLVIAVVGAPFNLVTVSCTEAFCTCSFPRLTWKAGLVIGLSCLSRDTGHAIYLELHRTRCR